MQGGDKRGAEHQPDTRLEDPEELTLPTPTHENEIDMQEGGTGVKRGPAGCFENPSNGKLRRREGIKRGLQDMLPVSYEEYDTSWDLEDQSKRSKTVVNCLLASCRCKTTEMRSIRNESRDDVTTVESSRNLTMPVQGLHDAAAEQGRQAGTRGTEVQPFLIPGPSSNNTGWYSITAVGSSADATYNHSQDTTSQLYNKPRRIQSS